MRSHVLRAGLRAIQMRMIVILAAGLLVGIPAWAQSSNNKVSESPSGEGTYQIQPGDQLEIKLFYNPELNEQLTVRPDGRISLQLIGEVQASGATPAALATTIQQLYAKDVRNPQVTVMVRGTAEKIFVDGEVGHPGMQPWNGHKTILQAIAEAGGLKDTARTQQILVIRRDAQNHQIVMDTTLKQMLKAGEGTQLQAYDVVYVPTSHIANVNRWVDQYIRKNIPITFGVLGDSTLF